MNSNQKSSFLIYLVSSKEIPSNMKVFIQLLRNIVFIFMSRSIFAAYR